jgi:hypothetical protein
MMKVVQAIQGKTIIDNLLCSVSGITSVLNCNSPEKPACLL